MSTVNKPLKYLFEADFSDDTTYSQGWEDRSLKGDTNPDGSGRSAMSDVWDREKLGEVIRFRLVEQGGKGHTYEVDLQDGHFEIDGIPFEISPQHFVMKPGERFRLVFNREMQEETDLQITSLGKGKIDAQTLAVRKTISRYQIGWQALNHRGKNVLVNLLVK